MLTTIVAADHDDCEISSEDTIVFDTSTVSEDSSIDFKSLAINDELSINFDAEADADADELNFLAALASEDPKREENVLESQPFLD